jgi:TM2 domain-containing membrane protein YozV
MSYLVKQADIDKHGKNALTAGWLSIFFGSLGVHRFYLKRPLSGWIILITTLITFGLAAIVFIPLQIIEGILLFVQHQQKNKLRQAQAASPFIEDPMPQQIEPQHSIAQPAEARKQLFISDFVRAEVHAHPKPADDVAVYDVSDVKPSTIRPPEEPEIVQRQQSADAWISRLELPYERRNLRIPELREAVYATYAELAKFIDLELEQYNTSLEEVAANMPRDQFSYYNNFLYTIFCIAEGHVTGHYTANDAYDNTFSYDLLRRRTNADFVKKVRQYASELANNLPPASDEIKRVFGLTPNGLMYTWWDADGYLREHSAVNSDEEWLLGLTPSRSTKLYEIPEIRWLIFRQYFIALEKLREQRRSATGWKVRIAKYLDDVFGNKRYVSNTYSFMILTHILKLAEQAVREKLPYTRSLNIDNEIAQIRKAIPRQAADAVQSTFSSVALPKLSDSALNALRAQNPSAWKQDVAKAKTFKDTVTILNLYLADPNVDKLAKDIVKNSSELRQKLIALYIIDKTAKADEWSRKKIEALLHPQQLEAYRRLVEASLPVSSTTADKIEALTVAPRKRVVLDEGRMQEAHADHNRAVKSVTDYLGETEPVARPEPQQPKISMDALFSSPQEGVTLSDKQKEFIGLLLASDQGVSTKDAADIAKSQGKLLNSYLQALNKTLYELFEDQVIIQHDDRIVVEVEYREAVKELV